MNLKLLETEYWCIFKDEKYEHVRFANSMLNAISIIEDKTIKKNQYPQRIDIIETNLSLQD